MATNPPAGDGHRNGAVKKRSQMEGELQGEKAFTKRDNETGQFKEVKTGEKFKGVRTEK